MGERKGLKANQPIHTNAVSLCRQHNAKRPKGELTAAEHRFCELLASGYDKSQSWRLAWHDKAKDLNPGSIGELASREAKRRVIQTRVRELIAMSANKAEISVERVLQEMARMAFFDARKLFDADGMPLPVDQLDDDTAAAVVGVDVVTVGNQDMGVGQVRKIKLADKGKGLEMLARHLSMFKDTVDIKIDAVEQLRSFLSAGSRLPIATLPNGGGHEVQAKPKSKPALR